MVMRVGVRMQVQDNGPLIRFFDNKTCYSVHGETAIFIAREFYKTTAVVKYLCGPPATGLPSENRPSGYMSLFLGAYICLCQIPLWPAGNRPS